MPEPLIFSESYGSDSKTNTCVVCNDKDITVTPEGGGHGSYSLKNGFTNFLKSAFLPQGYPESVSQDYLKYQLWDTMQAFCSSITGTLATRAVLKGYGVGNEKATVAAATLTWMLKDGVGMIGRILFAWLKGTQLDCDAKRWRLFADILNDVAILMDLIAPIFQSFFVYITCFSSIARSIVGVAGGATRAALTLHQARRDNMADVSAKDGSQETLVNLMALIAGFIVTPLVTDNQPLVWLLFFIFTYLHLFANYRAVSSVVMETVNLPRFHILMKRYFQDGCLMNPFDVSLIDPVIRNPGYKSSIHLGAVLHKVLRSKNSQKLSSETPLYVIGYTRRKILIALHTNVTAYDIRKSAFHGLLLDMALHHNLDIAMRYVLQEKVLPHKIQLTQIGMRYQLKTSSNFGDLLTTTQEIVDEIYPCFDRELQDKGWDLKRCHLGLDEWKFSGKKNL